MERWNEVIAPTDRVLVLGDVAMGKIDRTLGAASQLRGYKALLAGNHDRCTALHGRKAVGWDERYRRDVVSPRLIRERAHRPRCRTPKGSGLPLPLQGERTDVLRYAAERPVDTGEWLVHGHVHESRLQSGRQINVGVDAWGGRIAKADEVVALIETGPRDLPRIEWSD